ncbi:MAG: hypothetical protein QOC99_298 [Acidobacteriota bacterium]|nr:hypothetical protein [Acidobacteriota bacterium]
MQPPVLLSARDLNRRSTHKAVRWFPSYSTYCASQDHSGNTTDRVHTRAYVRLKLIHEEISAGRYPTLRSLAELLERNERTVKRDLRVLRDQFDAPLFFDRERGGFRYREPGWQLPPVQFNEVELLAFFTAEHTLRATGHAPEAILLRAALAKLAAFLPPEVNINAATLSEALTFQLNPTFMLCPFS